MSLIIGTAGHIDHGKTALVKALTGQDTDRLKEEKERGISIDLGFAYLDLPDGTRAGVVDVPGHERFIRNMLAGAHGIDVVLFTVAADDGVMPQTVEHLDIVHLLRVPQAVFVITKRDLVSPQRLEAVEGEIRQLVGGTSFEGAPVVACSSVTGEGLDALRQQIVASLRGRARGRSEGHFRLPIDRVFLLQGHGLVVTGTATGGEIRVGARVRCLPGEDVLRVRSIHVHNRSVDSAAVGQRVALNLAGLERPDLTRGHVVASEALTLTSERFDAWIEVRPGAVHGLKHHQRVRVHLGTAERAASVRLIGTTGPLAANDAAYCQIVLAEPVLALRGDRFVVRDEPGQRTLGGGVVVHPWPQAHRAYDSTVADQLKRLHQGNPADVVETFLESAVEFAVASSVVAQFLDVPEGDVAGRVGVDAAVRAVDVDGQTFFTTSGKLERLRRRVVSVLEAYHAARPLAAAMDVEALRDAIVTQDPRRTSSVPRTVVGQRLFRAVIGQHCGDVVSREGGGLRLTTHRVTVDDENASSLDKVRNALAAQPLAPPSPTEMTGVTGLAKPRLLELLRFLERQGAVVRVSSDLWFSAEAVARAEAELRRRWGRQEPIPTAEFRDAVGTTRKFAVPLLEYFDRVGVTARLGEVRRLRDAAGAGSGAKAGTP